MQINNKNIHVLISGYITEGSFGDLLHARTKPAEKFKECGYYVLRNNTYDLENNITQTFIVLNTNLYYHNSAIDPVNPPKGQLISKCPYEKSVSSKIPKKIFLEFCPEIFCSFLGGFLEAFLTSWGLSNIINKEDYWKPKKLPGSPQKATKGQKSRNIFFGILDETDFSLGHFEIN